MSIHQSPISRRRCFAGLGVSLALPWLESLAPADGRVGYRIRCSPHSGWRSCSCPTAFTCRTGRRSNPGIRYDLRTSSSRSPRFKKTCMVLSGLTHDKGRANGEARAITPAARRCS